MSDEKVLTKEIVEQFLQDDESVELSEFSLIDDDAAEALAKHEGSLWLDGLTAISERSAEYLNDHNGDLCFGDLGNISEKLAALLCKKTNDVTFTVDGWSEDGSPPDEVPDSSEKFSIAQHICFSQVTDQRYLCGPASEGDYSLGNDLTAIGAQRLVEHCLGKDICLNGWYDASDLNVLKILCEGNFQKISLRFKKITADVGEILSKFKSKSLALEAEDFDKEAASELMKFPGKFIGFAGTKSIFSESDVRDLFEEHKSFKECWGAWSEPNLEFSAICGLCGCEEKFRMDSDYDESYGKFYFGPQKTLESSGWQMDEEDELAVCGLCADDTDSEDEDEDYED